jgi:hypothetical protein
MMQSSRTCIFFMFNSDDVPGPSADIDHPTSHKQSLLPHGHVWAVRDTLLIDPSAPQNTNMYALSWKDRKLKTIISNAGTTLPGNPRKRKRHKKVEKDGMYETVTYYKEISRPSIIELIFSCFGAIDVHNHYRQGSLAFERQWYTHSWWHNLFTAYRSMYAID